MEYNYLEAVSEDVRNYIDENKDEILYKVGCMDGDDPEKLCGRYRRVSE